MIPRLFRASVFLTGLLVAGIAFALAMPYDDSPVQAFMTAPENCGGTCLLGIQPGTTRVGETMVNLRSHPWVSDVVQNAPGTGYAQITWQWSGQQPRVIDDRRSGLITFYWDDDLQQPELVDAIIETITVHTHIRMYSLQSWLGEGSIGSANIRPDGNLGYSVIYDVPGGILNLTGEMPCPVDMLTYWNARTRVTLSIGRVNSQSLSPLEMVKRC